mgnify:FL=1
MKVLVVDIQKGITNERLYNYREFMNNTSAIVSKARQNGVEVIYIQHDDGPGTGFSVGDNDFEIADYIAPYPSEKVFIKNKNSCFSNSDFINYVKDEDILIIIGLQTNFCIDATVRSAFERGYRVFVPNNANSTFDNDYMDRETTYRYYNEMMWQGRYAECISIEDTLKLIEQ